MRNYFITTISVKQKDAEKVDKLKKQGISVYKIFKAGIETIIQQLKKEGKYESQDNM